MGYDIQGLTFYDGAASGQQRSALKRLEPPAVMISHATHNNTPWPGDYDLFIDPGGYHHMQTASGEYKTTEEAYLEYIRRTEPDVWALRDYPCESDLLDELGRTVRDHQERTLEDHLSLLEQMADRYLPGTPAAVLQGHTISQYLEQLDRYADHGILDELDYVGIGTLCRRNEDKTIANIILSVREALPSSTRIHAFGVKRNALRFEEVVEALESADSSAYGFRESKGWGSRDPDEPFTWRHMARAYLNWRHDLSQIIATESLREAHPEQTTLAHHGEADSDISSGASQ